uniref:hypothetical protein n=1 Tax=Sphaeromyxa zaharoni TaxID=275449 RepID=UPI0030030AA7
MVYCRLRVSVLERSWEYQANKAMKKNLIGAVRCVLCKDQMLGYGEDLYRVKGIEFISKKVFMSVFNCFDFVKVGFKIEEGGGFINSSMGESMCGLSFSELVYFNYTVSGIRRAYFFSSEEEGFLLLEVLESDQDRKGYLDSKFIKRLLVRFSREKEECRSSYGYKVIPTVSIYGS